MVDSTLNPEVKAEEKKVIVTRIGITKKDKSKSKCAEKISKNSRRKNRR